MNKKIKVQENHINQLTKILMDAVEQFGGASVEREGFENNTSNPVREKFEAKNLADNIQVGEPELESDGTINASITDCLVPAFKAALKAQGHDIHPVEDGYVWKQSTLSIKSATTISEVWSLSVSGHDLKEKLGQLTELALRNAATQALRNEIAEIATLNKTLANVSFYPDL